MRRGPPSTIRIEQRWHYAEGTYYRYRAAASLPFDNEEACTQAYEAQGQSCEYWICNGSKLPITFFREVNTGIISKLYNNKNKLECNKHTE